MSPTVGVLALQGAFIEHINVLSRMGVDTIEIRTIKDLGRPIDALIFPGGESTAIRRLIEANGLQKPLQAMIRDGIPTLGTCAGMILLAHDVIGGSPFFDAIDISITRNAYGRQLGSFIFRGPVLDEVMDMVFIRAPKISRTGSKVDVIASIDAVPVAVREKNVIATAFHPELSGSTVIHALLLSMI